MTEFLSSLLLFLILLGSSAGGLFLRPLLSERHRGIETVDLVRLVVTMLVTFAALVLGLLTTSVKSSFDQITNDFRGYAVDIIALGRSLQEYGPETQTAHALLRSYTAAAIASTWTNEPAPAGGADMKLLGAPVSGTELESTALGDVLTSIEQQIRQLDPSDTMHRILAVDCLAQFERLVQDRWRLIEEAHSSITLPFCLVLGLWLVIVFACFGLSAPRNLLVFTIIALGALSIASAVYVILDLDTPFTGGLTIPSQPMRDALNHLNR
jgi:hypothetical protein